MFRLPAPKKVFLQLKHNTDASSIKSISGVTLSENARSQGIFIKCRAVFDIEIKLCIFSQKRAVSIFERNIGQMIMLLKVLKYFIVATFFYLLACGNEITNWKK